jgi:hypothetical protein
MKPDDLQKLNQEDPKHLSSLIMSDETKTVIKHLPTKKILGPNRFSTEFCQNIKEDQTSVFLKLFHKIQKEG